MHPQEPQGTCRAPREPTGTRETHAPPHDSAAPHPRASGETHESGDIMRKMFILYGPQGAGKTTFVRENHLEDCTVNADAIRLAFSRYVPATDGQKVLAVGEHLQRLVRRIVQEQAESLMFLGSPVIIDAVNASQRARAQWHSLADSYGYDVLTVDFTAVPRAELIARNQARGGDKVADIESFLDRFAALIPPQTITPQQMLDCFQTRQLDLGNRPVVVVGDVQSCGEALGQAVAELGTPDTKWVFVGDLFDRGSNAGKVWQLLQGLDSAVVVGNHERALLNAVKGREVKPATKTTLQQLLAVGATKTELGDWYRSTVPFYDFRTGGREFFVSHGGVLPATIRQIRATGRCDLPDDYFIFGVGTRGNTYRCRREFKNFPELGDSEIVQLHGHRNEAKENFVHPGVINLESGVERDGWLSVYAIDGATGAGEIHTFREPRGASA